jgi:hypothetical protein
MSLRSFCVSVAALRRDDHSSKESYHLCKKDYETEEEVRTQQRAGYANAWLDSRFGPGFFFATTFRPFLMSKLLSLHRTAPLGGGSFRGDKATGV